MLYNHLSDNERNLIDFLFNNKRLSISNIAKELKRSKSTISREIRRNAFNSQYLLEKAIKLTKKRKFHKFFFRFRKYEEFTSLFLQKFEKNIMA